MFENLKSLLKRLFSKKLPKGNEIKGTVADIRDILDDIEEQLKGISKVDESEELRNSIARLEKSLGEITDLLTTDIEGTEKSFVPKAEIDESKLGASNSGVGRDKEGEGQDGLGNR